MARQTDINPRMRAIVVDWLVEVHLQFNLEKETLYLAVHLMDRFLQRKVLQRNKLQLLGCACMLIAAKYEEIFAPNMKEFVHITDNAFTEKEASSSKLSFVLLLIDLFD
jgi:cyclin B